MIRIDWKIIGDDAVLTIWVKEEEGRHSGMGRLTFTKSDFKLMQSKLNLNDEADGFSSSQRFVEIQ